MKFIKTIIFLIIIFVFGTSIGLPSDETALIKIKKEYLEKFILTKNNVQLNHVKSFPDENHMDEGVFLLNALNLAVDESSKLIYAPDNADHKILVFDFQGKFVRQIGQKGQGPSDLFRPMSVMLWNNYIVVNEVGNLRVQFLDKNGKYVKSFKCFKSYYSMVISENGTFYGLPINKTGGENLIDALSNDGKLLFSFGKRHKLQGNKEITFNQRLFVDRQGNVYLGYERFSIIKKFSAQGKLLKTINLNYLPIINAQEYNVKEQNSEKVAIGFSDFWIQDETLFVARRAAVFEIIAFNMSGEVKTIFWNDEVDFRHFFDFAVIVGQNEYTFFTTHMWPDRQIDIYKCKK